MGEIGGNDYNHALVQGIKIDQIKSFVPAVVSEISSAIEVNNNLKLFNN